MFSSHAFRGALLLLVSSCTIIEDSDLITAEDLEKIRLTGIEITQEAGNLKSTSTMNLLWDSTISIGVPDGLLTRTMGLELTGFRGKKLKFKSGESSALTLFTTFLSDGRPYRFGVLRNDDIVELYRFKYNSRKQLARIAFFLGPDNLVSRDSIVYDNSGKITTVLREEFANEPGGDIHVEYESGFEPVISRLYNSVYQFQRNSGNCPFNVDWSECFAFYRTPAPGAGGSGEFDSKQVNVFNENGTDRMNAFTLREHRVGVSVSHEPDTYYFHPLMLLQTYFANGNDLLTVFMPDWYSPGQSSTGQTTFYDESVTFTYIYGL